MRYRIRSKRSKAPRPLLHQPTQLPEGNAEQHAAEATPEPVKPGAGTMQLYGFYTVGQRL